MNLFAAMRFAHHMGEARIIRRAIRLDWKAIERLQAQGKDIAPARRQLLKHRAELHDHIANARNTKGIRTMNKTAATFATFALVVVMTGCAAKKPSSTPDAIKAETAAVSVRCYQVFSPRPVGAKPAPADANAPAKNCLEVR